MIDKSYKADPTTVTSSPTSGAEASTGHLTVELTYSLTGLDKDDVNAILNAVGQYAADNHGSLPAGLTANCSAAACDVTGVVAAGNIDLCPALVTSYLAALPVDPLTNNGTPVSTCNATYVAGYTIQVSAADNRVTVTAPAAELSQVISVTR